MGSEVVRIFVGESKVEFTVHKQLLLTAGRIFSDMFPPGRKPSERVTLGREDPEVFKLFIEYLYTKNVPQVLAGMTSQASSKRLRDLCQLYAFADKFQLEIRFCNRIMDAIQDGYLSLDKLPGIDLIKEIYLNTPVTSKLRQFGIASLLYSMSSSREDLHADVVAVFIAANGDALLDFVHTVKALDLVGRDPRVRDCQGSEGCVECQAGGERAKTKHGTWPCQYHIHCLSKPPAFMGDYREADEGCYLWAP